MTQYSSSLRAILCFSGLDYNNGSSTTSYSGGTKPPGSYDSDKPSEYGSGTTDSYGGTKPPGSYDGKPQKSYDSDKPREYGSGTTDSYGSTKPPGSYDGKPRNTYGSDKPSGYGSSTTEKSLRPLVNLGVADTAAIPSQPLPLICGATGMTTALEVLFAPLQQGGVSFSTF